MSVFLEGTCTVARGQLLIAANIIFTDDEITAILAGKTAGEKQCQI
jgi:hypothetical protein